MTNYVQVVTTTETKADAQAIANAVVEKRLAGCVQIIGPITSTYRWQEEIETAEEWLCLIKSRADLYEQLEQAILEAHPYEVPEILAVPVVAGSQRYLEWLEDFIKDHPETKFIDATEGGARIAGARIARLGDTIRSLHETAVPDLGDILKGLEPTSAPRDFYESLAEALSDLDVSAVE